MWLKSSNRFTAASVTWARAPAGHRFVVPSSRRHILWPEQDSSVEQKLYTSSSLTVCFVLAHLYFWPFCSCLCCFCSVWRLQPALLLSCLLLLWVLYKMLIFLPAAIKDFTPSHSLSSSTKCNGNFWSYTCSVILTYPGAAHLNVDCVFSLWPCDVLRVW